VIRLNSSFVKSSRTSSVLSIITVGLLFGVLFSGGRSSRADTFAVMPHVREGKGEITCSGGALTPHKMGTAPQDLDVTGACTAGAGTYVFKNVLIFGSADGKAKGSLAFADAPIDFWAESILIENNGTLTAGVAPDGVTISPVGTNTGGKITIHLYGAQQSAREAQGVLCHDKTCGIPKELFESNMMDQLNPKTCTPASQKGGTLPQDDCFYMYDAMPYDNGGNVKGFYGYKVLGIGYGGTLRLYGKEGATYPDTTIDPSNSGTSWVRLNNCAPGTSDPKCTSGVLQAGATTLTLSGAVDWKIGDKFVVTTTDYLTSHTEQLTLSADANGNTLTIAPPGLQFPHHASAIDLTSRIPAGRNFTDLTSVDTRAAVGLLSRSITIVSGGDKPMTDLPSPAVPLVADPKLYFGGHVVFRQGFKQLQIQGVEFNQLGEGGRIGHYPVHFHMARQVPPDTFIKDSSIWDSMTRWVVLHATQGVLLARNVGYRSIGMGYYLEDGTEVNNKLYANLGVSAIAAVDDKANTRLVPGILASSKDPDGKLYPPNTENTPYDSDYEHPSLFWIMNGWNDFEYNMAVGAEMCGNCYWMPPGANSGGSRKMNWKGYASLQQNFDHQGTAPLQEFLGNTCSTAMMAFHINGNTSYCAGINTQFSDAEAGKQFHSIKNDLLPLPKGKPPGKPGDPMGVDPANETFYPRVNAGGNRQPTKCDNLSGDCSTAQTCASGHLGNCMVMVLDRFTTSFNFAEENFAAIWLRPQFNLVLNSAITDVLNGGLTFVTGGGYTRADALPGIWDVARKSVFIGNSQDPAANAFATNAGPVNPDGVKCGNKQPATGFCAPVDKTGNDLGVSFSRVSFGVNQRFFNIYDGPALEDSNAFLDITATQLTDCLLTGDIDFRCFNSKWMQGTTLGLPGIFAGAGKPPKSCYLPNAAIAWKQPNGFYYPPSFHSTNLFFNNVEIRHYVVIPRFLTGSYKTDDQATKERYCNRQPQMFSPDFTDIDRQTELNDDDGSLTGLIGTVSVNEDNFFHAPTQDTECQSDVLANTDGTAVTSPYDYVTTVVYPDCAKVPWAGPGNPPNKGACNDGTDTWSYDCADSACYGVPMYRQLLNNGETTAPFIRLASQATGQRETMNPNNGVYYIDTTVDRGTQTSTGNKFSIFEKNKTYHVFLLFGKDTTKETYQIFVGKGLDKTTVENSVNFEKVDVSSAAAKFNVQPAFPIGWTKSYQPNDDPTTNKGGGILTVTVNLSAMAGSGYQDDVNKSIFNPLNTSQTRCQPSTMCAWNTTNSDCECNISDNKNDPLGLFYLRDDCMKDNGTAFCKWAVSDIDYPDAGAYGFSFTLGDSFATAATQPARDALRPDPSCFPKTDPLWNLPFNPASSDVAGPAGMCFYASGPPSPMFCQ